MDKKDKYHQLINMANSVIIAKDPLVSKMANLSSLIQEYFNHLWVGFYFVDKNKNELYLGPFQGALACTKIQYGKGVCGTAWAKNVILNVEDVHDFDGHIACSTHSNSEIVVPILDKDHEVIAVLDIDSINFNQFENIDEENLQYLCTLLM